MPSDSLDIANSLDNLACAMRLAGYITESLELHKEALAKRKKTIQFNADNSLEIASSYNNIGLVSQDLGLF